MFLFCPVCDEFSWKKYPVLVCPANSRYPLQVCWCCSMFFHSKVNNLWILLGAKNKKYRQWAIDVLKSFPPSRLIKAAQMFNVEVNTVEEAITSYVTYSRNCCALAKLAEEMMSNPQEG